MIVPVNLNEDGIDVAQLEEKIAETSPQFVYMIPNFQNPTGITHILMEYVKQLRRFCRKAML